MKLMVVTTSSSITMPLPTSLKVHPSLPALAIARASQSTTKAQDKGD